MGPKYLSAYFFFNFLMDIRPFCGTTEAPVLDLQIMYPQTLVGVRTHDLPSVPQHTALNHSATPARLCTDFVYYIHMDLDIRQTPSANILLPLEFIHSESSDVSNTCTLYSVIVLFTSRVKSIATAIVDNWREYGLTVR